MLRTGGRAGRAGKYWRIEAVFSGHLSVAGAAHLDENAVVIVALDYPSGVAEYQAF